jgi:hypothetical protein
MFKGVSQCMPSVGVLYFGPFSPFHYSPFTSHPPFFKSFQYISYILYLYVILCDITDVLSFSFPFPLSPSSIEYFHCYRHVLHLSLYVIMFVFVYMFIFGSIGRVGKGVLLEAGKVNEGD